MRVSRIAGLNLLVEILGIVSPGLSWSWGEEIISHSV